MRYLADQGVRKALEVIPRITAEFQEVFGRNAGGLLSTYRTDDAELITIALGSVNGTVQDVVDQLRTEGYVAGSISIRCYRPFPYEALRRAVERANAIVVLDRSVSPGADGPLVTDVRVSLPRPPVQTYA